jgi:hypothetical protein
MKYKVKYDVKTYTKAGISPTQKDGNEAGLAREGWTFDSTKNVRGWLAFNDLVNRWIPLSACEVVTVVPPPPDEVVEFLQTRRGTRIGEVETLEPWEEWIKDG